MCNRFQVLAVLVLLGLSCPVLAESPKISVKAPGDKAITGDQGLERQKTIVWLDTLLKEAVPAAHVEPIPGRGNSIILKGRVKEAQDVKHVLKIADSQRGAFHGEIVNALVVGEEPPPRQVQIDVVLARVATSKLKQADADLAKQWEELNPRSENNFFAIIIKDREGYLAFIRKLREANLVEIRADLKLVTMSGKGCNFQDGGTFHSPKTDGTTGTGPTPVEFGTKLSCLPVVLANGKISLEVEPDVSELGPPINGFQSVTRQQVRTTVELEDGQTFAIGGLIQNRVQGTTTKVPLLGDIPILKEVFSVTQFEGIQEELVILVTAYVLAPRGN